MNNFSLQFFGSSGGLNRINATDFLQSLSLSELFLTGKGQKGEHTYPCENTPPKFSPNLIDCDSNDGSSLS